MVLMISPEVVTVRWNDKRPSKRKQTNQNPEKTLHQSTQLYDYNYYIYITLICINSDVIFMSNSTYKHTLLSVRICVQAIKHKLCNRPKNYLLTAVKVDVQYMVIMTNIHV